MQVTFRRNGSGALTLGCSCRKRFPGCKIHGFLRRQRLSGSKMPDFLRLKHIRGRRWCNIVESIDGRADQKLRDLLVALERSYMALDDGVLRSRLSITVTDGAYAWGETNSPGHNPSHMLPDLWRHLRRPEMIGWDAFHRWNLAGKAATSRNHLATAFFKLVKELDYQFGFGQGRLLDRQVAAFMGVKFLVGKSSGGTREFVYLSGAPDRFLKKFPSYYRMIELRRHQWRGGA